MTDERFVQITPTQVARALMGKDLSFATGKNVRFRCDDLNIFKVDDNGTLFQACTRAGHGIHKRFKDAEVAMALLVSRTPQELDEVCPECGGSGWVDFGSYQAIQSRVLSVLCKIFRGIELPIKQEELTTEILQDTLESCFTGTLPSEPVTDPPNPAGTSDPGRVILPKEEK